MLFRRGSKKKNMHAFLIDIQSIPYLILFRPQGNTHPMKMIHLNALNYWISMIPWSKDLKKKKAQNKTLRL